MEVGAVKQAFNNEVIQLKNKLNQAKIQIIHKLTRKAKTLVEKKTPDQFKDKLKRKAESAVNEVLIIKKIKPRDIAKFTVTHTGELKTFLNRPQVDNDKACARLLLHKALQDRYKLIRHKFSNIPIEDLLMSRLERRKLKKEEKEAQKAKKKAKHDRKAAKANENWDVEDLKTGGSTSKTDLGDDEMSGDEADQENGDKSEASIEEADSHDLSGDDDELKEEQSDEEMSDNEHKDNVNNSKEEIVKASLDKPEIKSIDKNKEKVNKIPEKPVKLTNNDSKPKKQKNRNKNDNLGEKLLLRKSKKEEPAQQPKIVDPFFITSTGENYVSVAEPRKPDEVKAEHRQGNRQYRRAVMFGHEPKIKPRRDNFRQDANRFQGQNSWDKNGGNRNNFNSQGPNNRREDNDRNNFRNRNNNNVEELKPEKLHPSWEAKKKQSGILPFHGKKIVFDEN